MELVELVELSNRRIVESSNSGTVENSNRRNIESSNCGSWNSGMVKLVE